LYIIPNKNIIPYIIRMNNVLIVVEINTSTKDIKFLGYYVSNDKFSLIDNNKSFNIPEDAIYKNIKDVCNTAGLNKGCISINNDKDNIQSVDENNYYGFIRTTTDNPNKFEILSSNGNALTTDEIGLRTTSEITIYDPNESSVNASKIDKPIIESTGDKPKELIDLKKKTEKNDTKDIIEFNEVLINLLTLSSPINTITNNPDLVDATSAVANAISDVANALSKLKSPSDITQTKDTELKNAVNGIADAIGVVANRLGKSKSEYNVSELINAKNAMASAVSDVANTLNKHQSNNNVLSEKPQIITKSMNTSNNQLLKSPSQINSVSNSSTLVNPINKLGYALVDVAKGLVKSKSEYNVSELIIAKNVMASAVSDVANTLKNHPSNKNVLLEKTQNSTVVSTNNQLQKSPSQINSVFDSSTLVTPINAIGNALVDVAKGLINPQLDSNKLPIGYIKKLNNNNSTLKANIEVIENTELAKEYTKLEDTKTNISDQGFRKYILKEDDEFQIEKISDSTMNIIKSGSKTSGGGTLGENKAQIELANNYINKFKESANIILNNPTFLKLTSLSIANLLYIITKTEFQHDNKSVSQDIKKKIFLSIVNFLYSDFTFYVLFTKNMQKLFLGTTFDEYTGFKQNDNNRKNYTELLGYNEKQDDTYNGFNDKIDKKNEINEKNEIKENKSRSYTYDETNNEGKAEGKIRKHELTIYIKEVLRLLTNFQQHISEAIFIGESKSKGQATDLPRGTYDSYDILIPYIAEKTKQLANLIEYLPKITSNTHVFIEALDGLIYDNSTKNIITYLKLRNDDEGTKVYNKRFNISTLHNKGSMLVKYRNDNFPLHQFDASNNNTIYGPLLEKIRVNRYEEHNGFKIINKELMVTKYTSNYLFGKFTDIFAPLQTNSEIAKRMTIIKEKVLSGSPVFMLGYGASGAGKTSSLVYFNKGKTQSDKNGILIHLCNQLSGTYKNLEMSAIEFSGTEVVHTPSHLTARIKFKYDQESTQFILSEEYTHNIKYKYILANNNHDDVNSNIKTFKANTPLGVVAIYLIDTDRFVKATTNNPKNSSRSHKLIFIKLTNEGNSNEDNSNEGNSNEGNIIIGDFAGVENKFICDDPVTIRNFLSVKRENTQEPYYSTEMYNGGPDPLTQPTTDELNKGGATAPNICEDKIKITDDVYDFDNPVYKKSFKLDKPEDPKSLKYAIRIIRQFMKTNDKQPITEKYNHANINTLIEEFEIYVGNNSKLVENTSYLTQSIDNIKTILTTFGKEYHQFDHIIKTRVTQTSPGVSAGLTNTSNLATFLNDIITNKSDINTSETITSSKLKSYFEKIDKMKTNYINPDKNQDKDKHDSGMGKLIVTQVLLLHAKTEILNKQIKTSDIQIKTSDIQIVSLPEVDIKKMIEAIREGYIKQSNNTIFNNYDASINKKYDVLTKILNTAKKELEVKLKQSSELAEEKKQHIDTKFNNYIKPDEVLTQIDKTKLTQFMTEKFINVIKELEIEKACREANIKVVCENRSNEGVFINNSLSEVREVISKILYEKNKDTINISPEFIDQCLPKYCSNDGEGGCFQFDMTSNNETEPNKTGSVIFDEIYNVLNQGPNKGQKKYETIQDLYKKIIVSVFCVFNISRKANNPPPVPYMDINDMKRIFTFGINEEKTYKKFKVLGQNIIDMIEKTCDVETLDNPEGFGDKVANLISIKSSGKQMTNNINTNTILENFKYIIDVGYSEFRQNYTRDQMYKDRIIEFIQMVDNSNAVSAIGTLDFLDRIAKYNTVNTTCNPKESEHDNGITYEEGFAGINEVYKEIYSNTSPTISPTISPSPSPSPSPTISPSPSPSPSPTISSTISKSPTKSSTKSPTKSSTKSPTKSPTNLKMSPTISKPSTKSPTNLKMSSTMKNTPSHGGQSRRAKRYKRKVTQKSRVL